MREDAERRAREHAARSAEDLAKLSLTDATALMHELFAHQLELEMQNEELQRAHQEIEASRIRYFELYDLAPVGYFALDAEGQITEVNISASEMIGAPRATLIGQPLTRHIHAEDQDRFYHARRQLEQVSPQTCELRMKRDAREPRWVQLVASVTRDDTNRRMRVVVTDISARKLAEDQLAASEARYRAVVESSHDALMILDTATWEIVSANATANKMFGVASFAELTARPFGDYAPPQQPDAITSHEMFAAMGAEALVTGTHAFEWVQQRATGELFSAAVILTRIELSGQAWLQVSVRDLTDVKKLQARVTQADRLATMGMLAAGVGHEINNPLTYLLFALETIDRDLSGAAGLERQAEYARSALEGTRRIRTIARSLSSFGRNDSLQKTPQHINAAIESAITLASSEIQHRATVTTQLGDVPAVMAQDGKLVQVFLNLLINAAHAIREGNARNNRISVHSYAEGDQVVVEVADTGLGMTPETAARAFESFYTTKEIGAGSGLGLAICKNIITELGGEIQLETTLGVGTCFRCRLPAAFAASMETKHQVEQERIAVGEREIAGKILVIDDEPGVRIATSRLLGKTHEVVAVASGQAALEVLELDPSFDVILCDLMMPQMTGTELHATLVREKPELAKRVIFMTGGVFTPATSAYLAANPHVLLEKPFELPELKQLIAERVLQRRG